MSEIGIGSIVFGNWKIVELIGHGSFGTVYKIKRDQLYEGSKERPDQFSALKVIYIPKDKQEILRLRNMGMDKNSIQQYFKDSTDRILREIDVMYPLKGHGNIVTYEDCDIIPQESGIGSIILIRMELLTPINSYTVEHPMDEATTIQLGIDLCQALEACEKLNIIHRDIKPDNIFVNRFGSFKLGDFGIARTADGTTTGTMTGTYGYMAPEVFNGKKYNQTVDIYSLGIVLYQYLNGGRLPFMPPSGQNVTMRDIETASARRFSGKDIPKIEGIDPVLSNIVCKACAYRSENRYQSASELKEALLNHQRKTDTKGLKSSNDGEIPKEDYEKKIVLSDYNTEYADGSNSETIGAESNWKSSPYVQSQPVEAEPERKEETEDKLNNIDVEKQNPDDDKTDEYKTVAAEPNWKSNTSKDEETQTATTQEYFGVNDDGHEDFGGNTGDTEEQKWKKRDADKKKAPEHNKRSKRKVIIGIGASVFITNFLANVLFGGAVPIPTSDSISGLSKPLSSTCKTGDVVTYGTYEQDGDTSNGAEDIEWIVLDVQRDQALLISKYGMDAVPYNNEYASITWENCTLRQWLNNDFLNAAFTGEEQNRILLTTVVNDDNPDYGTEGGNDTEDYIFCLSLEEAGEYFGDDARICNPTEYAINQGIYMSSSGSCWWWLRSPGYDDPNSAAYVSHDGGLHSAGRTVPNGTGAVRPALWVEVTNLES